MAYTPPSGNQVALPIGGGVTYTPPAGNLVALPIEDIHPAPVAIADAYSIALNTARTVASPGVLSNDVLYSGTITSHTSPAHGSLTFNSDGSFTYTPTTGYSGSDSYTYTLGNDNGFATATVMLTIYAPPIAVAHSYNVVKNTALTLSAPGLLNGSTLNAATITANSSPSHGTLALNPDGSFIYTPTTGYVGNDSFTFTLSNYAGASTATITLVVTALPVAVSDSYATNYGTTLTVAAPGPLYNDDLEGAAVTLGSSTAHGALTFNSDGSFVYIPGSGFSGADSFTYTLTNAAGTSTATVNLTVNALPPTIRYLQSQTASYFTGVHGQAARATSGWNAPPTLREGLRTAWGAAPRYLAEVDAGFVTVPRKTAAVDSEWTAAPSKISVIASDWIRVASKTARATGRWTAPTRLSSNAMAIMLYPIPRIARPVSGYVWLPTRSVRIFTRSAHAPLKWLRLWSPWNYAPKVRWTALSPGIVVPSIPPSGSVYIPPRGDQVDLPLECLWFDEPGDALALPIGPYACYASTLFRRSYIVINSLSAVRLPERTPISIASGRMIGSVDDMYLTFTLNLADASQLSYLAPDGSGNKLLEIKLNGRVYVALIENPDQQWQFPGSVATVYGRSQAIQLDAPFAPIGSYVQPSDMTAQQIINALLEFTGFDIDYGTLDWLIPAGTFHYSQLTPLAAIKTIAAAAGAIVQPHPYNKTLVIRPRYPTSSWNWPATSPDKTIPWTIVEQPKSSAQNADVPFFNNVLVSGAQIGVSDPIIRSGSAGDVRAPNQIIDPLIVTHPIALERGRNELSNTGKKAIITLSTLLAPADDTSMPGLILPLDLCSVVAPTSYVALCTACEINFSMQQAPNGAHVLVVDQAITLERQLTNAN